MITTIGGGESSMGSAVPRKERLYLQDEAERRIQNRLSRLEGQVRGIKKMLAHHESCDDILVQVAALKQAVNAVAVELLQAHMETCVLERVEVGEGKEALESLKGALSKVLRHI
ncbi:MAG: metal-sensitive transcriptional regulator [Gemmatimonadetes bacterium]|nr:metal-sensitive transcriptional regulator [Gemmatimonadota bacterium]